MEAEGSQKFKPFHEETILCTPLPQATSTVDKRPDLLPLKENMSMGRNSMEIKNNYLSDNLNTLEELRKQLNNLSLSRAFFPPVDPKDGKSSHQSLIQDVSEPFSTLTRLSLPTRPSDSSSSLGLLSSDMDKHPFIYSSDDISEEEKKHQLIRMKALETLNLQEIDIPLLPTEKKDGKENEPPNSSISELSLSKHFQTNLSTCSLAPEGNVSGFSELLHESDLKRDEEFCAEKFGPLKSTDISLSGIFDDRMSTYFHRREDDHSLLSELGPADPLRPRRHHNNPTAEAASGGTADEVLKVSEKENSLTDLTSALKKSSNETRTKPGEVGDLLSERLSRVDSLLDSLSDWSRASSFEVAPLPASVSAIPQMKPRTVLSSSSHDSVAGKSVSSSTATSTPNMRELVTPSSLGMHLDLPSFLSDSGQVSLTSEDSPPRVSDIAKLLKEMSLDTSSSSLANRIIELHDSKNKSKDQKTLDSLQFSCGEKILEATETVEYNVTAAFGGAVLVELPNPEAKPENLWILDHDESKTFVTVNHQDTVKLAIFPLKQTSLQVSMTEKEAAGTVVKKSRIHLIKISVESPQVFLVNENQVDFGSIVQGTVAKKQVVIGSRNSSCLVLCPKLIQENGIFEVEFEECKNQLVNLYPGEYLLANITVKPKADLCKDSKPVRVDCLLNFCLPPMLFVETCICSVPIKAEIYPTGIQVRMDNSNEPLKGNEERKVFVRNISSSPVTMAISSVGWFTTSTQQVIIPPHQIEHFSVTFIPQGIQTEKGEVVMKVGTDCYSIELVGKPNLSDDSSSIKSVSCPSSVPSSSAGSVDSSFCSGVDSMIESSGGKLELDVTLQVLVWASLRVDGEPKVCQTSLRCKGSTREKILLKVLDPTASFQLLLRGGERTQVKIITLSPGQRKNISVEFSPKVNGQIRGEIQISRVRGKSETKRVYLFGFGGCGQLRVEEVSMDLAKKSFEIPLKPDTFTGQFTLRNIGDGSAFFNIQQKRVEGLYMSVVPERGILEPGQQCQVALQFRADAVTPGPSVLNQLLKKDRQTDVHLSSLTITYGDEPTRLRISRIIRKYGKEPVFDKCPGVKMTFLTLSSLFPVKVEKRRCVSELKEPWECSWDLYEAGVQEWAVNVIIERKALEEKELDTTQLFVSFSEHRFDETNNTTFFHGENSTFHSYLQ